LRREKGVVVLHIHPSADSLADALTERLEAAVAFRPGLVLGLPTGRTPVALYSRLARRHREATLSFARAQAFQLDEFCGLDPDDPARFSRWLDRQLFDFVDFAPERIHRLHGEAPDAEAECARYDAELDAAGGLDLALLGIGSNGHVAFNEPADAPGARTRRVRLTSETRDGNAGLFGNDASRVPSHALTLGLDALMRSREVWLIATGDAKAEIVRAALEGPVTPRIPASLLRNHPRLEVWLDAAAAGRLSARTR
jgi:glucosamine-6-phosphate deaminase